MQQDMDLARLCVELAEQSRHAVEWLQDNSALVGSECAALQKDMRHAARFFNKCEQAVRRKMCVGVFGPSQSGKSYLISALARDPQGALLADFSGRSFDFITEINPEGGKESTGLVTRFTTTPPADANADFPIRLRLLTEADVVRVLANTYYADCEHKEASEMEPLLTALQELTVCARRPSVEPSGVSSDDVEDIREYLNKNFSSRPRVQMLQKAYWTKAMELAPFLTLEDRARLFGLIWDSLPRFSELYIRLCSALRALGFPAEANCPIEALIPRQNSIIDVALLCGLNDENGDTLPVLGAGGRKAELPRAVVTALTAEITVHMHYKPDDFFDHTDLLDFPGYRSRLKLDNVREELERPREDSGLGLLENLFLRGKVAYLFERYCEEKELTSMLLCIGPGNQEVQDLPRAVQEWICSTHGENPAHRAGKAPALFFVLSKMDMEFEKKKGAPNVEARWNIRLQSSLLDFFGKQHDWPTNWDGTRPFNNVFLLRNPNFRCEAIFDFADDREAGIRADQKDYVEEVHQAFLNSPLVQNHVADPETVWQAAMTLNDGGVGLLRQKLRPLCNPELKRRQISVILDEKREQTAAKLTPFYKSDDREELRRRQEQLSRTLVSLLAGLAEKQLFGEFLADLQVHDFDLHEICFRMGQDVTETAAAPSMAPMVGTRVSANAILNDIFGDEATPTLQTDTTTSHTQEARDNAALFVSLALEHWAERLRDLASNTELRSHYGLPAKELDQLCHEIIKASDRWELRRKLTEELRRNAVYSNMARERLVWKQVSLAADAINAFIDWLGFDPRYRASAERTVIFGGKNVTLFEPPAPFTGEPRITEEESPYDRLWYTDWLRALAWNIMANVDFEGGQQIDHEQNDRLRRILQAFRG